MNTNFKNTNSDGTSSNHQNPAAQSVQGAQNPQANSNPSDSTASSDFLATTIQFQRAVAQRVAQRAANAEVLSPGEWLRRVGGLQAPFGFDGMPTVLG